jgi:hypothetical protein
MVLTISAPEANLSTTQSSDVIKDGENRVALTGISWIAYQQILNALPQSRSARLTYDRSPTFPWMQKEYLYNFLAEATQDEIAAEVKFRVFAKEKLGEGKK